MKFYRRVIVGETDFIVEVVESYSELERGLGGRERLPRGSGMLFLYSSPGYHTFWMKGMNFPIDIIGFDNNDEVVHIFRNVQPELGVTPNRMRKYKMPKPISMALEINANESVPIQIGDRIRTEYNPNEETLGVQS